MHLITGGSGFLGTQLAERLLATGQRVRILDLIPPPATLRAVDFRRGNVCDPEALREALRGVEVVHHLAALVPVTARGRITRRVNVEGTKALARLSAGRRFFFVSSSAIFGGSSPDGRISSSTPPCPIEVYGRSKWEAELALAEARADCTILRPRTILGPGRLGIFSILFRWVREGRKIYTLGSGENLFQLIHVEDFIDAYLALYRAGARGTFNVGGGEPIVLNDLLGALIRRAGSGSRIAHLPERPSQALLALLYRARISPLAPWHYLAYGRSLYFDETNHIPGWRARRSATETLLATYEFFLQTKPRRSLRSPHRRMLADGVLALLRRFS